MRCGVNTPKLVADVEALVLAASPTQALTELTQTFTRVLVAGEQEKLAFLDARPDLTPVVYRLEDQHLLRGSLSPFDLDPTHLPRRADAFTDLFDAPEHWPRLTGALLTAGDSQRRWPNSEAWQFGTGSPANDGIWRTLSSGAHDDMATRHGRR